MHILDKSKHIETLFTLETQMTCPTSNGAQRFIQKDLVTMIFIILSSSKIPSRMRVKEKIERYRGSGGGQLP
jgi:hypothetical protein